jgi:hypothetical protein
MFGCSAPSQPDTPIDEESSGVLIRANTGGVVVRDRVSLSIPPGSLSEDTFISIAPTTAPDAEADGFARSGLAFEFSPPGTQFALDRPAILTMPYDDAAISAQALDGRTLQLAYFDELQDRYVSIGGEVDTTTGTVTARVEHFTLYVAIATSLQFGNNAPIITPNSPIPSLMRANAPIYFRALVRDYDTGGSVAGARLNYRHGSNGAFASIVMQPDPTALDVFYALLPASEATIHPSDTDLQYYFSAVDNLAAPRTTAVTPIEFTRTYQPGTLAIAPTTQNIAAGFDRLFAVTGRDETMASFVLVPEQTSVDGGVGLSSIGTTGVTFKARTVGNGVVHTGFGSEGAMADVAVFNGALANITILDEHGNPIIGSPTLRAGERVQLDALGHDAWGNTILVVPTWGGSVHPGSLSSSGLLDTLDATGSRQVTANVGDVIGSQWFNVLPRILETSLYSANTTLTSFADRDGVPYLVQLEDGAIHVRHFDGMTWIDHGGPTTTLPVDSVAIATSTNRVQIAWAEGPHIRAAHLEGTTWVADGGNLEVDVGNTIPVGISSNRMSLAFDGETPWLAWYEHSPLGYRTYLASWNGTWNLVGGGLQNAVEPSLAFLGGVPHVAYSTFQVAFREILVTRWTGSSWSPLGGGANIDQADIPSLAIVGGTPTVAFRNIANVNAYQSYVRRWNGGGWIDVGLGPLPAPGALTVGISLSADGNVPYVGITAVASQADSTRAYKILHFNSQLSLWRTDVDGPVNSAATLPNPILTVKVIGSTLYNARTEPGGDTRVSVFH